VICCVDGLKGFPEAIEAIFPKTVVQTCIVHLMVITQVWLNAWEHVTPFLAFGPQVRRGIPSPFRRSAFMLLGRRIARALARMTWAAWNQPRARSSRVWLDSWGLTLSNTAGRYPRDGVWSRTRAALT
jgi:transposase-like protein